EPSEEHNRAREPLEIGHNSDLLPLVAMRQAVLEAHLQVLPDRSFILADEVVAYLKVNSDLTPVVEGLAHPRHEHALIVLAGERTLQTKGQHIGREVGQYLDHALP